MQVFEAGMGDFRAFNARVRAVLTERVAHSSEDLPTLFAPSARRTSGVVL